MRVKTDTYVTRYNVGTIFSRTIDNTQTRPAHKNNFAVRVDDNNFFRGRCGGLLNLNRRNLRDNFYIKNSAGYGLKICQAVNLDNSFHADIAFVHA